MRCHWLVRTGLWSVDEDLEFVQNYSGVLGLGFIIVFMAHILACLWYAAVYILASTTEALCNRPTLHHLRCFSPDDFPGTQVYDRTR
eukprot:COSAG02_NODE_7279_length_3086_cov_3.513559_4_plen_87_part_00